MWKIDLLHPHMKYTFRLVADVAELADALDSKSGIRKGVWVRPPPSAPPQFLAEGEEGFSGLYYFTGTTADSRRSFHLMRGQAVPAPDQFSLSSISSEKSMLKRRERRAPKAGVAVACFLAVNFPQ
jgi:hypothetical protein